jgi:hypothetical protein
MYVINLWGRYNAIVKAQMTQSIKGLPSLLISNDCASYGQYMSNFTSDVNLFFDDIDLS